MHSHLNPLQIWSCFVGCQAYHVLLLGDRCGQGNRWRRRGRRNHRGGEAVPGEGQADDPTGSRQQKPAQLFDVPDA